MDARLGYAKRNTAGRDGGNSRNGRRAKIVLTDVGPVEIDVPRGPGCLVQLGDRGQAAAAAVDWYGGRVDLMQTTTSWPGRPTCGCSRPPGTGGWSA
jgi:Transposase, Mutator family